MDEFVRLKEVSLRTAWPHEARDFTPWLAENLSYLTEPLGIELELEAMERKVGAFRADIVCRDKKDNSRVIIENQLDASNHPHLGKVITYAAGLDASTIIWLATEFRTEHRNALEWLNRRTDRGLRFFGVKLQVFQIEKIEAEEFRYVPLFTVVTNPAR